MTQRVAVVGATGHIGRPLCRELLRTGYVLTQDSLTSQVAQFRRHLGGWIGTGRGWTPWIHIADEVGLIVFALQQPGLDGPVNLTAPEPVPRCPPLGPGLSVTGPGAPGGTPVSALAPGQTVLPPRIPEDAARVVLIGAPSPLRSAVTQRLRARTALLACLDTPGHLRHVLSPAAEVLAGLFRGGPA